MLHIIPNHLVCSALSQNCFELFIPDHKDQVIKACKTEADGRVVEGNHTFYRISAPTAEEKDVWINSIKWAGPPTDDQYDYDDDFPWVPASNASLSSPSRAAISKDPFYEMLASRKKKVSSLKGL